MSSFFFRFFFFFFFFNDTATTEIYTLSLHDALPISSQTRQARPHPRRRAHRRSRRSSSRLAAVPGWPAAHCASRSAQLARSWSSHSLLGSSCFPEANRLRGRRIPKRRGLALKN